MLPKEKHYCQNCSQNINYLRSNAHFCKSCSSVIKTYRIVIKFIENDYKRLSEEHKVTLIRLLFEKDLFG